VGTKQRWPDQDVSPIEISAPRRKLSRWVMPLSEIAFLGALALGVLLGMILGLFIT
jgi:hypothetical protein